MTHLEESVNHQYMHYKVYVIVIAILDCNFRIDFPINLLRNIVINEWFNVYINCVIYFLKHFLEKLVREPSPGRRLEGRYINGIRTPL